MKDIKFNSCGSASYNLSKIDFRLGNLITRNLFFHIEKKNERKNFYAKEAEFIERRIREETTFTSNANFFSNSVFENRGIQTWCYKKNIRDNVFKILPMDLLPSYI